MSRIAVTGGAGRLGSAVTELLLGAGHEVRILDVVRRDGGDPRAEQLTVDLTDLGDTVDALHGVESVVHLGGVFAPGVRSPASTLTTNVSSTFNVFHAAHLLGIRRIVWASTGGVLGSPWLHAAPLYLPVDEDHPVAPRSTYALSKLLGEQLGRHFADNYGMEVVGLRFSWIFHPSDYEQLPAVWDDVALRRFNLWGYVDIRDAAMACVKGLEADIVGARCYAITADDTVMPVPSRDLAAQAFEGVPIKEPLGEFATLTANQRAKDELGFSPQHSWRQHLGAPADTQV